MQRNQSGRVGPAQQGQLQLSMLVEEAIHEKGGWAQESGQGKESLGKGLQAEKAFLPTAEHSGP